MFEFENNIRIDRHMDEVFAFLSNFENIPKWSYTGCPIRTSYNSHAAYSGE